METHLRHRLVMRLTVWLCLGLASGIAAADELLAARAGDPVRFHARYEHKGEFLYYLFDWGDQRITPTAQGRSGFQVTVDHRWHKPGRYRVRWQAVTRSGHCSGWRPAGEVSVEGDPIAERVIEAATTVGSSPAPVSLPNWSSAPAPHPYERQYVGVTLDRYYALDWVVLTRHKSRRLPDDFAIEYTTDGGQRWHDIPSATFFQFPDTGEARLWIPLKRLVSNGLRVVSRRLPPDPDGGYRMHVGSLQALGDEALLFDATGRLNRRHLAALNNLWLTFGVADLEIHDLFSPWWTTEEPHSAGLMIMGSTIWSHWNVLKIGWLDREDHKQQLAANLARVIMDDDGLLGVTSNSFKHLGRSRHYVTNAIYISGVVDYLLFTRNRSLLDMADPRSGVTIQQKLRRAMQYQLRHLKGETGVLTITDPEGDGTRSSLGTNYWDAFPFGGQCAYANIKFYDSLRAMAELERFLGNTADAAEYDRLRLKTHEAYNRLFWDPAKGRYVGCIDVNGEKHDYGFTFVNLEAIAHGLVPEGRARQIIAWLDGRRIVEGDTSQGPDIYRFRCAPRANTLDIGAVKPIWYYPPYVNGPLHPEKGHAGEYGLTQQNGGAIFYVSFYDLLARLRAEGIENAYRRLVEILEDSHRDQLRRVTSNIYGHRNVIGIVREFPESGLVPLFFLYGLMGLSPRHDGLAIRPRLPADWDQAVVRDVIYAGRRYHIRAARTIAEPSVSRRGDCAEVSVAAGADSLLRENGTLEVLR
ncbi:MAG: hypothetical protein FJ279_11305 [Planctomycetes bacterium]|nr:hypothetical protein [Planctomycetota bacterium]MBM4078570.1 hypothetical protein [Planctomycetota bacterium]